MDPRELAGKLPPSSFSPVALTPGACAGWGPECSESAAAHQQAHHLEGWGELRRGPSYFLALVCSLQGKGVNEDRGWPPPNGPLKLCGRGEGEAGLPSKTKSPPAAPPLTPFIVNMFYAGRQSQRENICEWEVTFKLICKFQARS